MAWWFSIWAEMEKPIPNILTGVFPPSKALHKVLPQTVTPVNIWWAKVLSHVSVSFFYTYTFFIVFISPVFLDSLKGNSIDFTY